jgi:FKBP-type peptidyl-prolyl cis-trans isomerase FklB
MKKIFALLLAIAITAPIFMSCGSNSADIKTQSDSINYALGAANAGGIRQYVIMADTADSKKLNDFCKGIEKSLKSQTTKERIALEGFRMGVAMNEEIKTGFLFNDSTIPAKKDLIITAFKDELNGHQSFTNAEEGMQYFQNIMSASMQTGEPANLTPEQVDTVNMLLGIINGNGTRKFILGADTTKKDIKIFVDEFEKGLKNTGDNELYIRGLEVGSNMNQQFSHSEYLFNDSTIELKLDLIKRGLLENLKKEANVLMTAEEATDWLNATMEAKAAEKNKSLAAKGEEFLAENAKRETVHVTESGLQYEVITMGEGEKPTAESRVKVHYHGTLIDGTVFDSSVQRGEPIEFPLNGVIKGWTEGLQLMPVGSKFILYIPYQLAYGEQGAGELIGPCEALIFEVELLEIVE